MLKDITLGQYYPAASVIHSLDPRVKLVVTLAYIISLFVVDSVPGYILAALFLSIWVALSRVPLKFMLRGMRPVFLLLFLTVVFNLFLTPGDPLVTFWRIAITKQGLRIAILMAIRLVFLIIGSTVMTLTTTPNQLTDAMERLMGPLKRVHFPVHEIAMMMSIALRFIPILMEETDKIMKAQMARGADFEKGSVFERAKNLVPLLVPLFIAAFRRANDLALAMEARCYHGGDGRTKLKPLRYRPADHMTYVLLLVYFAMIITVEAELLPLAPWFGDVL